MCIIIATTFTVTWVPYQLDRIVLVYGNRQHALLVLDALETIAYVNSCVNPVIYALMWKPFRQSLIQVRRACVWWLFLLYLRHIARFLSDVAKKKLFLCYHFHFADRKIFKGTNVISDTLYGLRCNLIGIHCAWPLHIDFWPLDI